MLSILCSKLPAQCTVQHVLQQPAAALCAVEHSDKYLCTGGAYRRDIVEYVSKRAPSGSIVPFILVLQLMQEAEPTLVTTCYISMFKDH